MRHVYRAHVSQATAGARLHLSDADTHHLSRVVRRAVGDDLELMTDDGAKWPARIVEMGPPISVVVGEEELPAGSNLPVDVAVGLADFARLDMLVEKLTEIGVRSLTIFSSERVRRVPKAEEFDRRRARMERVAMAAAKQSGRARVLQLHGLMTFEALLADIDRKGAILVDPRGDGTFQRSLERHGSEALSLIVGPEAGFAERELTAARELGLPVAHLGGTVLRTETAALVAVVMVAQDRGYFLSQ